ncbi:MAG: hypothetical protein PHH16_04935 [Candidatus Gracilibacteria bacterium]|nr:hypothetical protein [Candidatus Gracilibacteria bacterium]
MDTNTLLIGVITGAFGTGYFIYGKKEQMMVPMLCGAILCIYPYFTDNIWILCGAGILFIALPFFWKI